MYRLKNKVDSLQKDLSIALTQAREQEREKLKSQEGLRIAEEKALEVRDMYMDIYIERERERARCGPVWNKTQSH